MNNPSAQLLASLGSGVQPFDPSPPAPIRYTGADFAGLLDRARSGNPETGLAVKLTNDLDRVLSIEQRRLLASAVDRAAVVGSESAIVALDDRMVHVDVRTRSVIGEVPADQHDPVSGIDAFVHAPRTDESAELAALVVRDEQIRGSARGVRNASLVHALPGNAPL